MRSPVIARIHPEYGTIYGAPQARRPGRLRQRLALAVGPVLMVAMGATVIASAQSASPFANKRKTQAWETPSANAPIPTQTSATSGASNAPLQLRGARAPLPVPAKPQQSAPPLQPTQKPVVTASAPASTSQAPISAAPRTQTSVSSRVSSTASASAPSPATAYTVPPSASPNGYARVNPNSRWALAGSAYNGGLSSGGDTDWTVHTLPSSRPRTPPGYQGEVQIEPNSPGGVQPSYGSKPATPLPSRGWSEANNGNAPSRGPYAQGQTQQTISRQNNGGAYQNNNQGPYQGSGPYSGQSYGQASGPYQNQGPYQNGPYGNAGPVGGPPPRSGFLDRIGLGSLRTLFSGGLRGGVAARESGGWEEAFVGDADVELEVSAITQTGLEWGVHGQVRAQYDEGRKGFTRRLPDCPPTLAGCPSLLVGGVLPASVRGHTSQFYTSGPDVAKDTQIALESAHLFLRSAYGDVTIGRDDGAAYLFSLGAPSLLNVGASNSTVDYTGLDSVKTLNDASGFAEKVTYTSPRLLGDQVGVGVQLGVSYAPDADACGVDYCVDLNDIPNVLAPDIADIMEVGVALDRTFANGMSVEGTLTYARGKEQSGQTGFENLKALGGGIEVKLSDWTLGGSYLNSNQGVLNGDYEAYDIGLTWQPSRLGFTLGYGHASDDVVNLSADQFTGGVSWDFNERFRLGAGAQYANRHTIRQVGATAQKGNENATAIFIEGGLRF